MGEIRFVGTGETRGYPYLVCKKRIVGPGKTLGYPYPVCKKTAFPYLFSVLLLMSVSFYVRRHFHITELQCKTAFA